MRTGTLSKFNRKKDLWISRKHPLHTEDLSFRTLYAAGVFMHARLNKNTNPLNNFQVERLITKGFDLTSKETVSIMELSKDIQTLVDQLIEMLDTPQKQYLFLFDLYYVSMHEYHILENEQRSIDLFADLMEISQDARALIFQFISSASCKEYDNCLAAFRQMSLQGWPVTMADLSYYMLGYSFTLDIIPEQISADNTYQFRGNCLFHGTIVIPKNCTVRISNAIVKFQQNIIVEGGTLIIENSSIEFSETAASKQFDHAFITSKHQATIRFKNSSFQCCHNGGLLYSLDGDIGIAHCHIDNTSFIPALFTNGKSLKIKHTDFKNCFSKQNGGAIYVQSGSSQIQHCTFTNCNSHNGGAIHAAKQTVISNCYFENCCAVEFGSAIYYNGEIRSNIQGCEYSNCFPKDDVIVQYISGIKEYIISKDTTIRYSTIFACPIEISVYGCLHTENVTLYLSYPILCRGMISMRRTKLIGYNFKGRDLISFETPKNCYFSDCEFDGSEQHGIFRAVRARLRIHGCIFKNTANGRAIYNAFLPVIEGCVFSHCQEGAVYCQSGKITNSQFINCRARSGGGIIMYGSGGEVERCHFERCLSNYTGGAIDLSGSYHVVDCTYKDCSS